MKTTRHFDIAHWADYVRGLGSASVRQGMREHLDEGCSRCVRRVNVARRMSETAAADARQTPPAYLLKAVKAFFALDRHQGGSLIERLLLKPTFDSAMVPAAQSVRSPGASTRQMVFEGGEFSLDVRLERPGGTRPGLLGGQLRRRTGAPVADAPAHLYTASELAISGFTDERGDFELALPSEAATELLLLAVDEGRCLVVDLDPGPGAGSPA